jgi:hypothetical protein
MQVAEELDSESIKRLEKQGRYLLRVHQAELAKDPNSHATESSRSNMMAVQHTVKQMYGEAVSRDVANLVAVEIP